MEFSHLTSMTFFQVKEQRFETYRAAVAYVLSTNEYIDILIHEHRVDCIRTHSILNAPDMLLESIAKTQPELQLHIQDLLCRKLQLLALKAERQEFANTSSPPKQTLCSSLLNIVCCCCCCCCEEPVQKPYVTPRHNGPMTSSLGTICTLSTMI